MSFPDVSILHPANSGHYIVEVKAITEDGELIILTEKVPVILWGIVRDKDHAYHGLPIPITMAGPESPLSSQLLPNGSVFLAFAGSAGQHLYFDSLDEWEAYEKPIVLNSAMRCRKARK
jgi:hypothetical protein